MTSIKIALLRQIYFDFQSVKFTRELEVKVEVVAKAKQPKKIISMQVLHICELRVSLRRVSK